MLPEGRKIQELRGFPDFVATPEEISELRGRIRSELNLLWKPVLLNPSLATEATDLFLEVARKLDYREDIWDILAYYYLTNADNNLAWELRKKRSSQVGRWRVER